MCRWTCVAAVVACAGVFAGSGSLSAAAQNAAKKVRSSSQVEAFLGQELFHLIQSAERAESFRVAPQLLASKGMASTVPNKPNSGKTISGLLLLGQGESLSDEQLARLKKLILSDDSYVFDWAKRCLPQPGIVLRLYHGEKFVDVLLCYGCSMWGFAPQGSTTAQVWEDFDPVAKEMTALAKAVFPRDEAIQSL